MKKLFLLLLIYGSCLFVLKAQAQCGTAVQNFNEDFNTLSDPNDRSVLPDCWGSVGGLAQMDDDGLLLALLGSSDPGTLVSPYVLNGEGVVTFQARKSSTYTVYLSVGYYSGGFVEATTYTLGSAFQTYTYDFSAFQSKSSAAVRLAFKITSGPNSGVQRLILDDIAYKSFCAPAADPMAIAKDFTAVLDATGNVIVNPASVDNGSTDDCGEFITNFSLDQTLFTCDDLGVNPVILTATDSEGHTATATANVTVEPGFVFNSNQLLLDEEGVGVVDIDFLTSSKTDCDDVTYVVNEGPFTCAEAGYVSISVTASYSGQTKIYTTTRSLFDYYNPAAIAQNITVSIDESTGAALITPEMIDDGSSDNCGIASMVLSKSSFDCADQGDNEVILTITDDAGRSSAATAIVTVNSFIEDVAVTTTSAAICFGDDSEGSGAVIETATSSIGKQYYLRNDADSSVVEGPVDGTGSGLSFNTGSVSENTTFHVYAEVPFTGSALDLTDNGRKAHLAVSTPGSFDYAAGYTFSNWIKLGSSGNSTFYNGIFYAGGATGSDIEVYESSNGNLTILHNRGNGGTQSYYVISGDVITNNTYVHFAVTYDGSVSRVFVNGVEKGSSVLAAPMKSAASEITFGYLNSTSFPAAQSFPGIIDDVRVYERALTGAEILVDYDKCITGTSDDLILYFDLESISGSIYTDLVSGTPAQVKEGGFATDDAAISCSFTCNRIMSDRIIIGDNEAPTVVAQDVSIELSTAGFASITVEMINNESSDNCSANESLIYSLDKTSFACEDIGMHTVTLTITDEAGNSASNTATVTVSSIIEDETVTPLASNLCPYEGNATTVSLGGSVLNVNYYLRNDADDTVVDGPIAGTGNALDFSTGDLTETTTFHVFASTESTKDPYALEFNKGNQYVAAGEDTNFAYDQGYTIETWVNAPFLTSSSHAILDIGTASASDLQIYVQGNTGYLTIVHDRSSGSAHTYFQYPKPPVNQWAHIAVTYDGGTSGIKVYYDGIEQTVLTSVNAAGLLPKRAGATLNIGRALTFNSSNDSFQGKMDEVRIWNSARSLAELTGTMNNCLSGTEAGLVSYFQFNEGTGTVALDLAGGNNGTLIDMDPTTDWITDSPINCEGCEALMSTEVTIAVGDNESPVVVTKDISVVLDAVGNATITSGDINNGSSDNCTSAENMTYSIDITAFDINDVGENTVTLSVTDASENVGTATAIVTISDKPSQVVTFTGNTDKIFGDADFDITATVDSSLPVSFTVISGGLENIDSGTGTNGGGSATFKITGAGVATLTATNDGDDNYAPLNETITIEIAKADQVLTVTPIGNKSVIVQPFIVDASVNTDLTLDYALTGPATIAGNEITLAGTVGTVAVTVSQAGNDNYNLITETISFDVVEQQTQAITFSTIGDLIYGAAAQTLVATSSAALDISFTLISGPATLTGSILEITGSGSIVVEASQVGNDDFLAASSLQTITVAKAVLTVMADDQTITYGDEIPTLTFNYSGFVNDEDEADLTAEVSINTTANSTSDAGSYAISLTEGEAANYSFSLVDASLVINMRDQIISVDPIGNKEPTDAAFDVIASVDSGLDLTYEVSGPATIVGTTITLDGTEGTVLVTVAQSGDLNHSAATTSVSFESTIILSSKENVSNAINIYPNPVSSVLNVDVDPSLNAAVSLFDMQGQKAFTGKVNAIDHQIDVSRLPTGLYILMIKAESMEIIKRQRVIIGE